MTTEIKSETFGERLFRLRTEQGLSQRDLSTKNISYAYISRLEAGTRRPSIYTIRELAIELGVTPNFLETGQNEKCLHCGKGYGKN